MKFLDSNVLIYAAEDTQADKFARACDIKERYDLQFYDALLLAAAQANGCAEFWSEDLNDGQMYGSVKAVNPFKGLCGYKCIA